MGNVDIHIKIKQLSFFDQNIKLVEEEEKESRGWKYRQLKIEGGESYANFLVTKRNNISNE